MQDSTQAGAPITLTLVDQSGDFDELRRQRREEFRRFTDETGIRVDMLPAPEQTTDQLTVWRKLPDSHSTVQDVYAVDVIWPASLAEHLLDLKPYVPAPEIAEHFPELIANFTVNSRLVALPNMLNTGLLF